MRCSWSCRRFARMRLPLSMVMLFVVLLMALGLPGIAHAERLFGDDVLVSGEPVGVASHCTWSSGQHSIGTIGDSVFVAWNGEGPVGHGIYLSRSLDCGGTFEEPCRVNDTGISAYHPGLAIDSAGDIHLAWSDKRDGEGPNWNVYFSKSTDGGETFGPDVRVDDAGSHSSWQASPAIAVDDSGRIYVVWLDERGNGDWGVYFSRSVDGGVSFDSSIALPNIEDDPVPGFWPQYGPSIAAAGDGRIYVSYVDCRNTDDMWPMFVCVRHSSDCGVTFSEPVDVAICGLSTQQTSIAAAGSLDVYVAWVVTDDGCYVSRSSDGGDTFGPGVQVNEEAALIEIQVSVSANSSGWIAVTWNHTLDTIGFAESRDFGASFLPVVPLTGPGGRKFPTVAIDEERNVYVAWTDYRHGTKGDIYFSKGVLDPPAAVLDEVPDDVFQGGLIGVKPNPFTSCITLEFDTSDAPRCLNIYDLSGRFVRALHVDGRYVGWDGLDSDGEKVSPGVYFISAGTKPATGAVKVIVVR